MPTPTYLIELTDDSRTGKLVVPMQRPEIQRPAADFVFDFIGAGDPARLAREKHLSDADLKLLGHLRGMVFEPDGPDLVIRDGVSFEANREVLDPDASLEEYFLPRRRGDADVYLCQIEVVGHDPDRARKRQMLAYQVMFMLHRFRQGYEVRADEVDLLRDLTEEAEQRGLLRFDMGKQTFVPSEDGLKAHDSLLAEARELVRRYDLFSDCDEGPDGEPLFGSGHGRDLRVPIYELAGINPFRARFVLGLGDDEWDAMDEWPRKIRDPRWFDELFAFVERCPTIEDVGRDRLERLFDAGRAELRGDADYSEPEYERVSGYGPGYYRDPFFANSWWWLLLLV
ncbi:MAG: hypothetical protein FJZ01_24855 [Candidatus Sericytochromatia bacterium]|nr:hypothetical protein [Candidatus Tanganyikabacteria bacterium]